MTDKTTEEKEQEKETADAVKQAKGAALTPDQKHAAYLADLERIANEP